MRPIAPVLYTERNQDDSIYVENIKMTNFGFSGWRLLAGPAEYTKILYSLWVDTSSYIGGT